MAMTLYERVKKCQAKYDTFLIRAKLEEGKRIRAAVKESGQSLNQYVLDAVRMRIEQEAAP